MVERRHGEKSIKWVHEALYALTDADTNLCYDGKPAKIKRNRGAKTRRQEPERKPDGHASKSKAAKAADAGPGHAPIDGYQLT